MPPRNSPPDYRNPWRPRNAIIPRALRDLATLVRAADTADPRFRLWLTAGIAAYCEGKVATLDAALGLQRGRGRRGSTPAAMARAEARLEWLRVYLLTTWSCRATLSWRVRRMAELLRGAEPHLPGGELDFVRSHAERGLRLPTSERGLWSLARSALTDADRDYFDSIRRFARHNPREHPHE